MPESEIKIKATGGEEVKKTFKTIHDYARQLDRYAGKSPLSSKEIQSARAAQDGFNKSIKETIREIKTLQIESRQWKKSMDSSFRNRGRQERGSKNWHEFNRDARYEQHQMESRNKKIISLADSYFVGKNASGRIDNYEERESGGRLGTIVKAAAIAAIGYEIGKGIKAGLEQTKSTQDTSISIAANMRGNNSRQFISDLNRPGSDIFGRGTIYGLSTADKVKAANELTSVGGQINTEDVMTYAGAKTLGVGQEMLGLRSQQVRAGKSFNSADMSAVLSDAVRSGLEDARRGEFIDSIKSLSQTFQQQGTLLGANQAGNLMSIMGAATYNNGQSSPFWSGAPGAANVEAINQGLGAAPQSPAKLMFLTRALRMGLPGGPKNIQQLNRLLLRGASDPKVISQIVGEASHEYGSMASEVLSNSPFFQGMFPGMNLGAADELVAANQSPGKGRMSRISAAIKGMKSETGTSLPQYSSFESIMGGLEGKGGTAVESAISNQGRVATATSTFTAAIEGVSLIATSFGKALALLTTNVNTASGSFNKFSGAANNGIHH